MASLTIPATALGAPITVTTTVDVVNPADGQCSLREAVSAANTGNPSGGAAGECPGGDPDPTLDMIDLDGGPSTYPLAIAGPDENLNASGDLDITGGGPLEIVGQGQDETILDGGGLDRVLQVTGGGMAVELRGLRLTGGVAQGVSPNQSGGAIWVTATGTDLTLDDVDVFNNTSPTGGGGIAVQSSSPASTLTVIDSAIRSNSAGPGGLAGGGILTAAPLTVTNSLIHDNSADGTQNFVRGGGGVKASAETTVTASTISDNDAGDGNLAIQDNGDVGGGIAFGADAPAQLTISNSTITGNSTEQFGGGLYTSGSDSTVVIESSTFEDNSGATNESAHNTRGGGIYNANGATLEISNSLFRTNSATGGSGGDAIGGAIYTEGFGGTTTITDSFFDGNSVTVSGGAGGEGYGGALVSGGDADTRVEGTTFDLNFALASGSATARGGAVAAQFGATAIVNSTIARNEAVFTAGSTGGGIQQLGAATVDVVNSTISGNSAPAGPGVHRNGTGDVTLKGTIVDQGAAGCVGGLTTGGRNVDAGSSCVDGVVDATDLPNTNPMLESLADNGGPHAGGPADDEPIRTMALPATSDAVDHIPAAECNDELGNPLGTDQRGSPRPSPVGGNCDVGAFERFVAPAGGGGGGGLGAGGSTALPSNAFDFGKVKKKKKKGIAFVIAFVPGPGQVGLAGKGIKNRGLASAAATKSVFTSGGRVKLKVVPTKKGKGRKIRQRLRNKGKAKVKVRVTYLPSGGFANARVRKFKLIRK